MVIYLCKGYVIFSFLKSRWSDDIERFLGYWQDATNIGNKQTARVDASLMDAAYPAPAWDVKKHKTQGTGKIENKSARV
ncbi:MAG TPA: hypothetical protein VGK06_09970 [Methanosarcina sp.]|jgi:hypothetical protein